MNIKKILTYISLIFMGTIAFYGTYSIVNPSYVMERPSRFAVLALVTVIVILIPIEKIWSKFRGEE